MGINGIKAYLIQFAIFLKTKVHNDISALNTWLNVYCLWILVGDTIVLFLLENAKGKFLKLISAPLFFKRSTMVSASA